MLTLYIHSDTLLRWDGMTLASSGDYVDDAEVSYVLLDAADEEIDTGSLTGSGGRYEGILDSSVELVLGGTYYLEVTAHWGSVEAFRRIECIAAYQDED